MSSMAPNQAHGGNRGDIDPWDVDSMPEVTEEDLFPYGHGPAGGD